MAHTLRMRATSVTASAALMALATLAALSMHYTNTFTPLPPDGPVIASLPETPPVTPPPTTSPPPTHIQAIEPQTPFSDQTALTTAIEMVNDAGPTFFDPGPPMISAPHWLRQPQDLTRYYPQRALVREIEGAADLDCIVRVTGQLACVVTSETPATWGFGEAALAIAAAYRMAPATRDGAPIEGRYRMRVPFRLQR